MLSGATASAFATAGTAVFRIVVSTDSMKKATATSHGSICFAALPGDGGAAAAASGLAGITLVFGGGAGMRAFAAYSNASAPQIQLQSIRLSCPALQAN